MGILARLFGSTKVPTVEYGLKLNDRDRCDQQKLRHEVEGRIHYLQDRLSILLHSEVEAAAGQWPNSELELGQFDQRISEVLENLDDLEDELSRIEQRLRDLRDERRALIEREHAPAAVDEDS